MQQFDPPWIEDRLRKIAALLIDAHRSGNREILAQYARRVPETSKCPPKRQFMQLIQVYHPDRLALYVKQVADLRACDNGKGLENLASLLAYEVPAGTRSGRARGAGQDDFRGGEGSRRRDSSAGRDATDGRGDWETEETYGYGEDDFGYDEEDVRDEYENYECDDYEEEDPFAEGSFMDAIKREFFGNLDLYPSRFEIEQFDGELDLSDYGLHDLSGVEWCVNINSLNLAMNRIDNVWPLRCLSQLEFLDLSSNELENADDLGEITALRELDLSFNDIDDVAFLLKLPSLKCVSLAGNRVRDAGVLEKLRKRGVVVVM